MKPGLGVFLMLAACGGGSSSSSVDNTVPTPTATCADVGGRSSAQAGENLPPGMPDDFVAQLGAMVSRVCTEDAWSPELIACAVSSDDPSKECNPMLDAAQAAHFEAEQQLLMAYVNLAMVRDDLLSSTGMPNCDARRSDISMLADCTVARDKMGEALDALALEAQAMSSVPEEAQAARDAECEAVGGELADLLLEHQCLGG